MSEKRKLPPPLARPRRWIRMAAWLDEAAHPAYVRNLSIRWLDLKNPGKSQGFWSHEWKKHGTSSANLYPQQAYFNLAMQLHNRLNNISPGASGNQLLSRLNNYLGTSIGNVPDFKCQLDRTITTPRRNLLKEAISCNNPSDTAIDCPIS
ncbi:hypothetical protein RJ640_021832 [Escallonia rubra]|uniref:Uncharacterized protein n=1 Tax=Escallonia rubra TaxID=112253 RepID=A0AA88ULR2_9ASTE|nr:hypothetical protein RJ640_021832 [Escallonia rubra]